MDGKVHVKAVSATLEKNGDLKFRLTWKEAHKLWTLLGLALAELIHEPEDDIFITIGDEVKRDG